MIWVELPINDLRSFSSTKSKILVCNIPHPSPSNINSHHCGSIGSSFSFGPQPLVDSFLNTNSSMVSNPHSLALDPNCSILPAISFLTGSKKIAPPITPTHSQMILPVFQDLEDNADYESEYEWGMVDCMRWVAWHIDAAPIRDSILGWQDC